MKSQVNIRISDSTRDKLNWLTERYGTQAEAIAVAVDRLYQGEKGAHNMDITVTFSEDGLFGADPDATKGVDVKASKAAFADGLAAELRHTYPGADVEVRESLDDSHRVDGRTDTEEAIALGEVVHDYWEGWTWVVNAE